MTEARRLNQVLKDLTDMSLWLKADKWQVKKHKRVGEADMYCVRDADGKAVFTLGFQPGDDQTRIYVEHLLTKGASLISGASLTMQMYVAADELDQCRTMKEKDGISDAYNDRNVKAWSEMKKLMEDVFNGIVRSLQRRGA